MKRQITPFGDGTIVLRLVEERDLKTILDWRNRDDARVWFKTSDKLTFDSHLAWYKRYLQKEDDLFFLVEADGRPVGQCGIYDIDHNAGSAEIGRFLVAPEMAGNGYIKRSCSELVRFGTRVLKLPYVFLEVMEQNTRAIELYTRCGFVEEGRSDGMIRMGFGRDRAS
ncbi:GNAT family N-acetyltransferase [Mesorhizobium amorphae]|uniref:GNAT family N-acetyltransferase n=1 Tax=Mesorhizobium amorphae TaxID=71433 RepID=UPI0006802869|nr:GNAT family N-acetyltransferase [Mesorhizobium amorphae]ANT50598.1 acetyltransferase [Mesorhizobium amorphae CCNWGS0123]GLR42357.1 spermidine N1-acetyltransferase [Mesorhizobium amorphae]